MNTIYCFIANVTDWGDLHVVAATEDGRRIASHVSSDLFWAKRDIGVDTKCKHDIYENEFPDGYELVWVDDVSQIKPGQASMFDGREILWQPTVRLVVRSVTTTRPSRNDFMEKCVETGRSVLVYGGNRPLGAWDGPSLSEWEIVWLAKRPNAVWFPTRSDEVNQLIKDERFNVVTEQLSSDL